MTGGIGDAFAFLLKSLGTLYVGALVVRFLLQLTRGNFRNPAAQFLLRVTHPVVAPVRRVVPPLGTVDLAMVVVIVVLWALMIWLLGLLQGVMIVSPLEMARITFSSLLHLVLNIYIGAVIIMVILSWIRPSGYHPIADLIEDLVEPVLRPFRRMLPTAGGIDFSPMLATIILFFLKRLLYGLGLPGLW